MNVEPFIDVSKRLWELYLEEVRNKYRIPGVRNFLGSVEAHKECYDRAVARLLEEDGKYGEN